MNVNGACETTAPLKGPPSLLESLQRLQSFCGSSPTEEFRNFRHTLRESVFSKFSNDAVVIIRCRRVKLHVIQLLKSGHGNSSVAPVLIMIHSQRRRIGLIIVMTSTNSLLNLTTNRPAKGRTINQTTICRGWSRDTCPCRRFCGRRPGPREGLCSRFVANALIGHSTESVFLST